jgi:predicted alpha/beta hydrolase
MSRGRAIPFDAGRDALYRPGDAGDLFALGPYRDDAALCAEMARTVYAPPRRAATALASAGFELLEFASSGGSQGFLAGGREALVLAFRGTESDDPRDIGTDIDFLPRRWERGGRVHRGFADGLDAVWDLLERRLPADERRLLFTGHSLGAALATLAASRRRPAALYTFGSPMVGNAAFGATLGRLPHARFQGCTDIVARIPEGLLDFAHCGTLHYLDRDGGLHLRPGRRQVRNDQARASSEYLARYAWRAGAVTLRELADHAPINYVSGALGRRGARVRY